MIERLLRRTAGEVRVRVTGASLPRFLNACTQGGVRLRRMERVSWDRMDATLSLGDFRKLRSCMGRTGCRVHILERRGVPFVLAHLLPRTALLAGLAVFCVIVPIGLHENRHRQTNALAQPPRFRFYHFITGPPCNTSTKIQFFRHFSNANRHKSTRFPVIGFFCLSQRPYRPRPAHGICLDRPLRPNRDGGAGAHGDGAPGAGGGHSRNRRRARAFAAQCARGEGRRGRARPDRSRGGTDRQPCRGGRFRGQRPLTALPSADG